MATLMQASHQWASRPADERFTSLHAMGAYLNAQRHNSKAVTVSTRKLEAVPQPDHKGLLIQGPNGHPYAPSHWAFGQLSTLCGAPASYLRKLPAELASDCLNYGFKIGRDVQETGILLRRQMTYGDNGGTIVAAPSIAAATGPNYGRVWNSDIANTLIDRFGDGVSGRWRVPGEFGRQVTVTKDNTTLYASDRDMFVFLADESNRIEIPDRRHGQAGELSRGFFVWNSEVGAMTLGIATFLFDYVCCNRIVWGATGYQQVNIRHTSSAPDRFIEQVIPAIKAYGDSSASNITDAIAKARAAKVNDLDEFLASRKFTAAQAKAFAEVHMAEEHRPIETLWDASVAITAYARGVKYQDERVSLERQAGKVMALAA